MNIDEDLILRNIEEGDCEELAKTFSNHAYKVAQIYKAFLEENYKGKSDTIVACYKGKLVGYATIVWESTYEAFEEEGIPEIKDIEVLDGYRQKGIASKLMDILEERALERCEYCGVGIGLADTYEAAQSLYAKRGYNPDGRGVFYIEEKFVHEGLEVDDRQALMMIKKL